MPFFLDKSQWAHFSSPLFTQHLIQHSEIFCRVHFGRNKIFLFPWQIRAKSLIYFSCSCFAKRSIFRRIQGFSSTISNFVVSSLFSNNRNLNLFSLCRFTTPHHKEGFELFLDTIVAMEDVWLVSAWQTVQWMRTPTPLDNIEDFKPFQCDYKV